MTCYSLFLYSSSSSSALGQDVILDLALYKFGIFIYLRIAIVDVNQDERENTTS